MTDGAPLRRFPLWHSLLLLSLLVTNGAWALFYLYKRDAERPAVQAFTGDLSSAPSKKVALLIGNSEYLVPPGDAVHWPSLPNPQRDVGLVEKKLQDIGFAVMRVDDADWRAMQDAIAAFSKLASGSDVALFYFAGHGFEYDRHNYLVPIDAPVYVESTELPYRFVDFEQAANAMTLAGTTVFMLDACRTSSGGVSITDAAARAQAESKNFNDYDFPVGKKVAVLYSTARGVPAKDGVAPNRNFSPFALEVADKIGIPRVELTTLFSAIRQGVYERTAKYAPQQVPYTYNSLGPNFFLFDGTQAKAQAKPAPVATAELKPLKIDPKRLATTDETMLAVEVLRNHPVPELEALARRGDPMATYLLGYMYEFGVGVPKDVKRALDYLEKAAAQGTPSGQLELAYFLEQRKGDVAAHKRAVDLFRKASDQGFAKAQAHHGTILMTGFVGVLPASLENYAAGLELMRKAARSGYPYAMYSLTLAGNADDKRTNRRQLETLAASGNGDADHWLCEIYMGENDYSGARDHCTNAATLGYSDAQRQMAMAAFNGWGRNKSHEDARHWLRQALSDPALPESARTQLEFIAKQIG
ncbi:hypothetical protein GRI89_01895 [Altererythrobacter salegens]|uniref:Caspase family p20 domain-containing protein n=1 Tax=Croceibacterium salegens TaxID=1737568 RepID=A0A6I4STR5_9SPHN|nr:caspase family protein [Croceibacterium salegens]MXO58296.1 hypothetical protein [Croceibacterium salegens]